MPERTALAGLVLVVARLGQRFGNLGRLGAGHLLGADGQHEAGAAGADGVDAAVERGGARRARVLDPGGGLEAKALVDAERQRCGEVLVLHPGVEGAEIDRVDVARFEAGIVDGLAPRRHDQRFQVHVR